MVPRTTLHDRPMTVFWGHMEDHDDEHKQALLNVLERAASDSRFIAQLTDQGEQALVGIDLDWRDEAALLSGDVRWIENRVGKLTPYQRTWLDCRLQQEIW